jgi:2-dehydropantoate 2-reductase
MGMSCRFVDDEKALLWLKLVFLGPFALATSAAGVPIGGVLGNAQRYAELESSIREFCAVAANEGVGIQVDKVIAAFFNVPKDMRSSMQKDLESGNLPELDAIAGPVLRGGIRGGVPTPVTRNLVAAIEQRTAQVQRR